MTHHALATVSVPREDAEDMPEMVEVELKPEAFYDAATTGILVGVKTKAKTKEGRRKARQNAVYQIPESELPVHWMGPGGGRRRYLGRDIMAYRKSRRSD